MITKQYLAAFLLLAAQQNTAFIQTSPTTSRHSTELLVKANGSDGDDRRSFLAKAIAFPITSGLVANGAIVSPASAQVYLDPAMYGDQELRQSAVQTLKEAVRRAILQNPSLASSFFQLALLDGLSYNSKTNEYGPDGRVVRAVLSSKDESTYMKNLKEAANALVTASVSLKKMTSITIADAVALGGAEAIQSIGGPEFAVQLGRTDAGKSLNPSPLDLTLLSGSNPSKVTDAFKKAGLTDREMTAILTALLTIELTEKDIQPGEWKKSKGKFRERGKIGRMSEFKKLTDEDIAEMEEFEEAEDNDWYIAESFGSRDQVFGAKASNSITEGTFNMYVKEMGDKKANMSKFGWIGSLLTDKDMPTTQAWLKTYGGSYLKYNKDLGIAYNAMTQLGAEYTGGKYENLLKNKPRKTLSDDIDLGF